MAVRSRGDILPGGGFSGSHSGYQVPGLTAAPTTNPFTGGGFDFGSLLQARFALQQKMAEEQLRRMEEDRMAAEEARMRARDENLKADELFRLGFQQQSEQARRKPRRTKVIGPDPGSYSPAPSRSPQFSRPRQWFFQAPSGETFQPYAPQKGGFAGGGSGQSATPDIARLAQIQRIAELQQQVPRPISETGMGSGAPAFGQDEFTPPSLPPGAYDPTGAWQTPGPMGLPVDMAEAADEAFSKYGKTLTVPSMSEWEQFVQDVPKQAPGPGSPRKEGGYIPKTGKYKLHEGEMVLNPRQTKAMFPGLKSDKSGRKSLQEGSVPDPLTRAYLLGLGQEDAGTASGGPQTAYEGLFPAYLGPGLQDVGRGVLGALMAPIHGYEKLAIAATGGAPSSEEVSRFLPPGEGVEFPEPPEEPVLAPTQGATADLSGQVGTYTPSKAYYEKTLRLDEESTRMKQRADELNARADQLEQYIFRRPHADNKAMKERVKSYRDEAKNYLARGEQKGAEFSQAMQQQIQLQNAISQAVQKSRQARVDSALESLNDLYLMMVKSDNVDDDQFVQGGMMILSPYIDEMAKQHAATSEEMAASIRKNLKAAAKDPGMYKWLELSLSSVR